MPRRGPIRCARRGPCPCRGGGQHAPVHGRLTIGGAHAAAAILVSAVETKRAVHRFAAIKTRSLHDPHGGLTVGVRPAGRCRESVPGVERGATLYGAQARKRRTVYGASRG